MSSSSEQDSRRRVCFVLYAPPFGGRIRTLCELPYRDFGRFTPTVLAAHDVQHHALYVLLYQQPDSLGIEQMSLYRIDPISGQNAGCAVHQCCPDPATSRPSLTGTLRWPG